MSDVELASVGSRLDRDRRRATLDLYCAVCGRAAPASLRPEDGGLLAGLQNPGWLLSPSRSLHGRGPDAAPNCLCPDCLATPSEFTQGLLRAWGQTE